MEPIQQQNNSKVLQNSSKKVKKVNSSAKRTQKCKSQDNQENNVTLQQQQKKPQQKRQQKKKTAIQDGNFIESMPKQMKSYKSFSNFLGNYMEQSNNKLQQNQNNHIQQQSYGGFCPFKDKDNYPVIIQRVLQIKNRLSITDINSISQMLPFNDEIDITELNINRSLATRQLDVINKMQANFISNQNRNQQQQQDEEDYNCDNQLQNNINNSIPQQQNLQQSHIQNNNNNEQLSEVDIQQQYQINHNNFMYDQIDQFSTQHNTFAIDEYYSSRKSTPGVFPPAENNIRLQSNLNEFNTENSFIFEQQERLQQQQPLQQQQQQQQQHHYQ